MPLSSLLTFLSLLTAVTSLTPLNLTVVNNCPFTICPTVHPNSGYPTDFCLKTLQLSTFRIPNRSWAGRIWARTTSSNLRQPGPITLADFSLHSNSNDSVIYSVSLVNGFNLPVTVTPQSGRGDCPVVGCRVDLLTGCPKELAVRVRGGGKVVGCKSACGAFGTDEYCCTGAFEGVAKCRPSNYSEWFKRFCPDTFTYVGDNPFLKNECYAPREMKVIFCH